MATSITYSPDPKATVISGLAGADLSSKFGFAVKFDTDNEIILAGAGEGIGILQNAPTSGQVAKVVVLGKAFAKIGGAITNGTILASTADGDLIAAVTEQTAIGMLVVSGDGTGPYTTADGDLAEIIVMPHLTEVA